jgi:yecA family protein
MLTVTFDDVEAALAAIDASLAPAEAHGSLCGALVAVRGLSASDWLDSVASGAADDEEALRARNLLEALFDETATALSAQDMEFAPLLPDDEDPLERRVSALAEWCAGFLSGIGTGELPPHSEMPPEVEEVLRDFGEIGRATVDGDESEESNEASYAELVEYLRAGTQLAYENLTPQRERTDPA